MGLAAVGSEHRHRVGAMNRIDDFVPRRLPDADLVEQRWRKIGPHASLVLVAERLGCGEIALSLLQQVGGDIVDSLGKLGVG